GAEAGGPDERPALPAISSARARPAQSRRNVIRKGIPAGGMPAFDLPAETLDALATMIGSLNAVAAKSSVPGDVEAGRQFFFAKGHCAACHMVAGQRSPI